MSFIDVNFKGPEILYLFMSDMEILFGAASLAALLVAVLAIWLSMKFYQMSTQVSEDTKEAAKDIKSSVEKLENIFNLLYKDTFSIMRDTVSGMQKQLWPETLDKDLSEIAEQKADERIKKLKSELSEDMKVIISKTTKTDAQLKELQDSMQQILDRAITESRTVEKEVMAETISNKVLVGIFEYFRAKGKDSVNAKELRIFIHERSDQWIDVEFFLRELILLRDDGMIFFLEKVKISDDILPNTTIGLTSKGRAAAESLTSYAE